MAGRGPAPKSVLQRESRTQAREDSSTKVAPDGLLRGPDLPEGIDWPQQTLAWWATWRTSPLAQTFGATDWDFLLDSALLHAQLWSGNLSAAPELRIRVAKFGATPEDRLRLKIIVDTDVDTVKAAPQKQVTSDRRRRLLKAVSDGA
jgi:hypothetical protein